MRMCNWDWGPLYRYNALCLALSQQREFDKAVTLFEVCGMRARALVRHCLYRCVLVVVCASAAASVCAVYLLERLSAYLFLLSWWVYAHPAPHASAHGTKHRCTCNPRTTHPATLVPTRAPLPSLQQRIAALPVVTAAEYSSTRARLRCGFPDVPHYDEGMLACSGHCTLSLALPQGRAYRGCPSPMFIQAVGRLS